MAEHQDLYALNLAARNVPGGLPLIAAMTGFSDTGSTAELFTNQILSDLPGETIATFDLDQLFDYRARRPAMFYDGSRLTDYEPPTIELRRHTDDVGRDFLFLYGPEPDFKWNAFVAAVLELVDEFDVESFTWVHSVPIPAPHTRPIGVTVSGNREALADQLSVWKPKTEIPTNVLHLLEYRAVELGLPSAGIAVLVPHYLGDSEFPDSAVRAFESVSAATGLAFPTDVLREAGRETILQVNEQVSENEELKKVVGILEKQHDSYMEGNAVPSGLVDSQGRVPSAEQIAAELEEFLATRPDVGNEPDSLP